jgi:hypothetical protein
MGINQGVIDSVQGKKPLLQGSRRWFIAAIVLHALYNIGATIVSVVFDVFSNEDYRFDQPPLPLTCRLCYPESAYELSF